MSETDRVLRAHMDKMKYAEILQKKFCMLVSENMKIDVRCRTIDEPDIHKISRDFGGLEFHKRKTSGKKGLKWVHEHDDYTLTINTKQPFCENGELVTETITSKRRHFTCPV